MDHRALLTIPEERLEVERAHAEAAEMYDRQIRRETILLLVICWCWILLGSSCIALGARSSNVYTSRLWLKVGLGIGLTGVYFTVIAWLVHRSERGDFG